MRHEEALVAPDMISRVFYYVQEHGELTNKAQSDWGQDRYEYNGITVGLGDAGYTKMIHWGDRLHVWWTVGSEVVFDRGTMADLEVLFEGVGNES